MRIQFSKMSGAGNDFVLIDDRTRSIKDAASLARKLCDRRWGIGADGLLLLQPSDKADYKMMYYNADGSFGGMCGNGGRCISRYAVDKGIATNSHRFEALSHVYSSEVVNNHVNLTMVEPADIKLNIVLRFGDRKIKVHSVNTGSPHVVIPFAALAKKYKTLEDVPVERIGKKIRYDKTFSSEGTNVNFVQRQGTSVLKIRTYERGVEGETLACGTGSVASAIIASKLWKMTSPIQIIPTGGIELTVTFKIDGPNYKDVVLSGETATIFSGEIDV